MALAILQNQDTFAPYSAIEKMYTALTLDKQREVFDFLCFLTAQNAAPKQKTTPKESYSAGFFDLFGACSDETFVAPPDEAALLNEDELF